MSYHLWTIQSNPQSSTRTLIKIGQSNLEQILKAISCPGAIIALQPSRRIKVPKTTHPPAFKLGTKTAHQDSTSRREKVPWNQKLSFLSNQHQHLRRAKRSFTRNSDRSIPYKSASSRMGSSNRCTKGAIPARVREDNSMSQSSASHLITQPHTEAPGERES